MRTVTRKAESKAHGPENNENSLLFYKLLINCWETDSINDVNWRQHCRPHSEI